MQIWLIYGKTWFRFPVIPPSYQIANGRNIETVTVNALGEIDLGGKRNLQEISFSSFFPKEYDPYYCEYNPGTPQSCVRKILKIMNGSAARLVMTGVGSFKVRISDFTYKEDDGTGDVSYDLTLKEHRVITIPASKVVRIGEESENSETESTRSTESAPNETTYTVKKGDCLSSIARKMTGSSDWHALYEANKAVIGSNPNLIYPGQELTIP